MKEIERLKRERYKKMLNLLPPMVAEKQAPSFFYHAFQRYIDWDSINLQHIKVTAPPRDDPATKFRKKLMAQKNRLSIMNFMGQQKTLKVDDEIHLETIIAKEEGNPIQFCPCSIQRSALYDKGCITCGKANIIVKYHKDRHICLECRQKITTLKDDPVIIFQDDDGEVVCLGVSSDNQGKRDLYTVQPNELKIFGYRCYVTFSAPDDLIILLDDKMNGHKGIPPSRQGKWACFQLERKEELEKLRKLRAQKKNFVEKNRKCQRVHTNFDLKQRLKEESKFNQEQLQNQIETKKSSFGRNKSAIQLKKN